MISIDRQTIHFIFAIASAFALNACDGCGGGDDAATDDPAASAAAAPSPFAALPDPDPALDMAKVELGRRLFFDTRLSGDGTLSCATCHAMEHGGAEPRATSRGIRGQIGPINAPTVLNSSLNLAQFWDGRAATLAEQAAGPVANPIEMGAVWDEVITRLGEDEAYVAAFAASYPDGISQANATDAIAEFERGLITPGRFDAFLGGDESALNEQERRGMETFQSTGCTSCHNGPALGGNSYQKLGLLNDYFAARGGDITEADLGRFNVTHEENDRHRFKVPTLRNVALTSPYFHDGSAETLEEAVRTMAHVQLDRTLTDAQVADIVAFLTALNGELPEFASMPEGMAQAPEAADDGASPEGEVDAPAGE